MSVIEWLIIGIIVLFFTGVAFYALGDLFRDRKYYKDKLKNVQKMTDFKNSKKTPSPKINKLENHKSSKAK